MPFLICRRIFGLPLSQPILICTQLASFIHRNISRVVNAAWTFASHGRVKPRRIFSWQNAITFSDDVFQVASANLKWSRR